MYRKYRVEEMREKDAMGLGDEAKKCPVANEARATACLHHFEPRLVAPVEDLLGDPA